MCWRPPSISFSCKRLDNLARRLFYDTRPNHFDAPAHRGQTGNGGSISGPVSLHLGRPKFNVRFRRPTTRAIVPMPKAPVHKNRQSVSRQHQIG